MWLTILVLRDLFSPPPSILKIEAVYSFATLVPTYQTKRYHNLAYRSMNRHVSGFPYISGLLHCSCFRLMERDEIYYWVHTCELLAQDLCNYVCWKNWTETLYCGYLVVCCELRIAKIYVVTYFYAMSLRLSGHESLLKLTGSVFLCGCTVLLLDLGRVLSFLILYTVGRTPWTGDQLVARPLPAHRTTQIQNKRTQTSIPRVGFEHMMSEFGRANAVYILDRAATVICSCQYSETHIATTHDTEDNLLGMFYCSAFITK
jgi:hypothetical protein